MVTGRCARCKKPAKVDKIIHLVWYTVGVGAQGQGAVIDQEFITRLLALQLDAEELAASLCELQLDMQHQLNVETIKEYVRGGIEGEDEEG